MKRIVILLAIVVAFTGAVGCTCKSVCIRTEKEETEKVIDKPKEFKDAVIQAFADRKFLENNGINNDMQNALKQFVNKVQ